MSEVQRISTSEGTIIFQPIFWPWPPGASTVILATPLDDGTLRIVAEPTGRLRVSVLREEKDQISTLFDNQSSVLEMPERLPLTIVISWRPGELAMCINGDHVISSLGEDEVPEKLVVQPLEEQIRIDFSRDNEVARAKRRARLVSYPQFPGKIRGDKTYSEKALRTAIKQMKDFIASIRNGDFHHTESMAALLRKLIATGDPLPHLQLVAAFDNKPLIVFGERNPQTKLFSFGTEGASSAAFATAQDRMDNPLDLDVWLDLPWGKFAGANYTHRAVLTKIGDTIGAHFSLDKHPTTMLLQFYSSDFGGIRMDHLVRYLLQAGETALALSERVLE